MPFTLAPRPPGSERSYLVATTTGGLPNTFYTLTLTWPPIPGATGMHQTCPSNFAAAGYIPARQQRR